MKSRFCIFSLVLLAASSHACGGAADREASAAIPVFVSIEPLRYFVARIGGRYVDVHVMVAPGQSPATYEPTARQMARLAEARVFFAVGVPIERQLVPRIRRTMPAVKIVDTRAGLGLLESGVPGRSGGGTEPDPHVWLDPERARGIARNVAEALAGVAPAHRDEFLRNFHALDAELDRLNAEIADLLEPVRGREMFVFHPAYGYFADAFGLRQVAIEAGGITPGSKHLADVVDFARRRGIGAVFVQPQFSATTARAIASAVGARVVTLDPLAPDYAENLRSMARKIRSALETGGYVVD